MLHLVDQKEKTKIIVTSPVNLHLHISNKMAQQTPASTSTTATLNSGACYDVFINHRGADVKKTFASHLYSRLLSHGLRAFLGEEVLEKGNCNLSTEIERAIRSASVHVAIFSPRYAESSWCLNELDLMVNSGSTIIPVFYHVKPADLRWTRDEEGWLAQTLRNFPWGTRGKDGVCKSPVQSRKEDDL